MVTVFSGIPTLSASIRDCFKCPGDTTQGSCPVSSLRSFRLDPRGLLISRDDSRASNWSSGLELSVRLLKKFLNLERRFTRRDTRSGARTDCKRYVRQPLGTSQASLTAVFQELNTIWASLLRKSHRLLPYIEVQYFSTAVSFSVGSAK